MRQSLKIWVQAARPKTLPAAISPVLIGLVMALADGAFHPFIAAVTLICAVLIQIGTNIANDYFDFIKGSDTGSRLGPVRVTQAGLVPPEKVRRAFIIVFSLAALLGVILIWRGGWVILAIGVVSIASGILYTAGPLPLAYIGISDLFVLIFFGPIAVAGTYYLQVHGIRTEVLIASLAPGLIATAILTVNNLRDIHTDRQAGKKTLAVRYGANFVRYEYLATIAIACLVPIFLVLLTRQHYFSLLATTTFLFAIPAIKSVFRDAIDRGLNRTLASTGRLLLIYSLLFSLGWLL